MKLSDVRKEVVGDETPFANKKSKHPLAKSLESMVEKKAKDERDIELQEMNDNAILVSKMLGCKPEETKEFKKIEKFVQEDSELSKAITAAASPVSDWVPTNLSNQLVNLLDKERTFMREIRRFDMTSDPFKIPTKTARATAYKIAEAGTATASDPTTSSVTFDTKKIAVRTTFSYEAVEDSIIPLMQDIKEDISIALADGEANAVLNGSNDNVIDVGNSTASDVRRVFESGGFRRHSIVTATSTIDLGTFNSDTISTMRKAMGQYGRDPRNLMWIASDGAYFKLLNLKDNQNNRVVIGDDVAGGMNAFKNGRMGMLWGSPLYATNLLSDATESTGKTESSGTKNKGQLLCVYIPGYRMGVRRNLLIEADKNINTQQWDMVASVTEDFQAVYPVASQNIVSLGRNITV